MSNALCTEDIVYLKDENVPKLAQVERTSSDVDTHAPQPWAQEAEPIVTGNSITTKARKRFLKDGVPPKGTVFIRWIEKDQTELIAEDRLVLLHRQLFIGDVVSRGDGDAMSGIVLNVETSCSLQPMSWVTVNSNQRSLLSLPPTWDPGHDLVQVVDRTPLLLNIPVSELDYEESPTDDDLIVYKGWIGRTLSISCALTLQLTDNSVVEVSEEVVELLDESQDLPRVGDCVKTKKGDLRRGVWKFGQYNANTPPIGTVVSSRPISIEVDWLIGKLVGGVLGREPPTLLERDEFESDDFRIYDRTRRPSQIELESTVSNMEIESSIDCRVRFRDLAGAAVKYDGSTSHGKLERISRQDTLGFDMNIFEITSMTAVVTVQWQDLSVTTERAVDLLPDSAIDDEHAAWPGEIAHDILKNTYDNADKVESTNKVCVIQNVNATERMATVRWCTDARIAYTSQDSYAADLPSGMRELVQGVVGVADGAMEELSLYDVEASAELNVRRGDIVLIVSPEAYAKITSGPQDVSWLGVVVDTRLDGTLLIRLGAADTVKDVLLRREEVYVAIRSDGSDEVDADGADDSYSSDGEESDSDEDEDEDMDAVYMDENGDVMDIDEVDDEDWESAEEAEFSDEDMADERAQDPLPDMPPEALSGTSVSQQQRSSSTPAEGTPESYVILDTRAPTDHHYISERSTSSPVQMKRTQKEHKILRSPGSIPNGVYVRTWESRLDLFRVLFVGPDETPYASAPFVIDLYLPTDFPHSPPQAFFHSWVGESGLGGVGRLNPNLYEDGKICLSLLGTWEGDKGEGWSAAKSTVLQVIVSLLGLVLVREPYFNEAGYEPLAGLESSKRPSALYNERTCLRANGFVVTVVTALLEDGNLSGLNGLKEELRWLYMQGDGPRLLDVVAKRVQTVLENSEQATAETNGLTVMSKGATIPLRRIAERFRGLMERIDIA